LVQANLNPALLTATDQTPDHRDAANS